MLLSFEDWLEHTYWPLMGEETPPAGAAGSEEESQEEGEGEGDPEGAGTAGGEGDAEGEEGQEEETEEVDDADLDELDRIKAERDKARQELTSAQAAVRKAKTDARKAREEAAKKGGNWEAVAKERQAEIDDANERAQKAEVERAEAQDELDKFRRQVRITSIAARMSFRDPEDAISALASKPEATADDKACERALRKLAEEKPYLIDTRRARGRAMGDGANGAGLTWEQVKAMPEEELNRRWDEVQPVLARGPSGG